MPSKKLTKLRRYQIRLAGRPCPELCELCGLSSHRSLHWDHDHTTGQFRGWICWKCNYGIGLFKDSSVLLSRASFYVSLERASNTSIPHPEPGQHDRTAHITRETLLQKLTETHWNKRKTAQYFGVSRGTLYRKIRVLL